ncbi:MAG: matrixin family metalloprotease [Candidatus Latescibacterota bacterium]|nr:MAG: matrixin family metalloprotease [Candidatus Latescibacterota bacterium]
MRNKIIAPAGLFVAVFLAGLLACDVNDPDRFLRPPIIKNYAPLSPTLTTAIGDTVRFSMAAFDPDDKELEYTFSLDDSLTSRSDHWLYVVHEEGEVNVVGRVTNGFTESKVRWQLSRIRPVNRPPEIVFVEPPDSEITIVVGASIDFSIGAEDPENKPLSYVYTVDGSIAGVSRHFTYHSTFVGLVEIRALVSDGEAFASNTWMLRVAAEPDSVVPARVVVTDLSPGAGVGELDVEWTGVGDDDMEGLPAHYIVRTSGQPITDEHSWNAASDRPGEPDPGQPGTLHNMVISDLPPAELVYVAVRAMDDFGNLSAISAPVGERARGMTVTGMVRDAVTNDPVPGMWVRMISAVDTTESDGLFTLTDLPAGYAHVYFWDGVSHAVLENYFDIIYSPYEIVDGGHIDMWMLPNVDLDSEDYMDFLEFFVEMTRLDGNAADVLGTWELPCQVYVPPLIANNLDYKQIIEQVFLEWEEVIELDVFEFVDEIPETGVYVHYTDNTSTREHYLVMRTDENGVPLQGRITLKNTYDETNLSLMKVIVRHEVGHALGMNHSSDPNHIMVGGRSPIADVPSPDEVLLARAMYRVPRYFILEWFRRD